MTPDPKLSEALNDLGEAVNEVDKFVEELTYFRNHQPPYPDQIRRHLRERATSAENLKIMALGTLSGLESSERWYDLLNRIEVSERYPTGDYIYPSDLRPSSSGLAAMGHVLENAIEALRGIELSDFRPKSSDEAKRGRRGPKVDFATYRKLADIVEKFKGDWKSSVALLEVLCEEIAKQKFPNRNAGLTGPSPPRSWFQAAQLRARLVVQVIEYRLKTVQEANLR